MRRGALVAAVALAISLLTLFTASAEGYTIELSGVEVDHIVVAGAQWIDLGKNEALLGVNGGKILAKVIGDATVYPTISRTVIVGARIVAPSRATIILSPVENGWWRCNASCVVAGGALTLIATERGLYVASIYTIPSYLWLLLVAVAIAIIVVAVSRRKRSIVVPY